MEKELIIASSPTEVQIALLEDRKLVELHKQKTNSNFSVGDIWLGKVTKLDPVLNAAFVDIGFKKDAFLHYTDLTPKVRSLIKYTNGAVSGGQSSHLLDTFRFEPDIVKTGKIDQVLQKKQLLMVQVLKEPISTKGPRLSCEVTIPGRYLVLAPFSTGISVSKKIANEEERTRLNLLIKSICPKNFGVIVRTAAEGKKVADLYEELTSLMEKWQQIHKQMHNAQQPVKLLSELDRTSSILRDLLSDSFSRVIVDDAALYQSTKDYLAQIAPQKVDIVKNYSGTKPVFEHYGVTRQIKSTFGKTTSMPSGAYLVIEHTEAMHVIDVNSGHRAQGEDQESNALNVNLEAADEIARQLRLRDIGGIIIIDFIDMRNNDHKRALFDRLRDAMLKDTAKHTILPVSKFGLIQITRERVRPEVNIVTAENCPTCAGTGKINASILITDDIERDLEYILKSRPAKKLRLYANPYVAAYLKKGFFGTQWRWYRKYKKWVRITANSDYPINEYRFFDENAEEIRLN